MRANRAPINRAEERRLLFRDRDAARKRNCIKAAVINIFRDPRRAVDEEEARFQPSG